MNFKKYHVSRNLFDLATAEDTNIYITNNGSEAEATNGDRFIAQQFMVSPSTQYTFSWADTILGTENNSPYIRVSEYNGGSFLKRTLYLCSDYPNKVITIVSSSSTNTFDIRYDSLTSNRGQTITKLMVNTGSSALPYEPYSSEAWHDIPNYILTTATDTFTTLPVDIYADGNNATVGISGNTVQNGTPTPDNPIMPQGTGERTNNLCDESTIQRGFYGTSESYSVFTAGNRYRCFKLDLPAGTYTLNIAADEDMYILRCSNSVDGAITVNSAPPYTFTLSADAAIYVSWRNVDTINSFTNMKVMLNEGSTALPYEPYGYKIPILINETITNIYIGDNPLRKSLDGTAYDTLAADGTLTQRVDSDGSVLATPIVTQITMPTFTLADGANTVSVDTTVQPSEMTMTYRGWHDASVKEFDGSQWNE